MRRLVALALISTAAADLTPTVGVAAAAGQSCTGRRTVVSDADISLLATTNANTIAYLACDRASGKMMRLPVKGARGESVAFALSGPWVAIETTHGSHCRSLRTLLSYNPSEHRRGFAVSARTCRIGASGERDVVAEPPDSPFPPPVLDDGPLPAVRRGLIRDILIAANGNFAWRATGRTYPASSDARNFGPIAWGLFIPAGAGHDTNLAIGSQPALGSLAVTRNTLSWTRGGGSPYTYLMPTPGEPVFPIRISGPRPSVSATPPGG
jgi:hypothetical protein